MKAKQLMTASKIILDMHIFSYEFDEKGLPIGLWSCKVNRPSEQWGDYLRYANGKLLECYSENSATGDRTGSTKGEGANNGAVCRPLLKEINKLLSQPYDYKEMPIRNSLSQKQQDWNYTVGNTKGDKFGFLGYRGCQYQQQ